MYLTTLNKDRKAISLPCLGVYRASIVLCLHSKRPKHRHTGANSSEAEAKNEFENGFIWSWVGFGYVQDQTKRRSFFLQTFVALVIFIVVCERRFSSGWDDSIVFKLTVVIKHFFMRGIVSQPKTTGG